MECDTEGKVRTVYDEEVDSGEGMVAAAGAGGPPILAPIAPPAMPVAVPRRLGHGRLQISVLAAAAVQAANVMAGAMGWQAGCPAAAAGTESDGGRQLNTDSPMEDSELPWCRSTGIKPEYSSQCNMSQKQRCELAEEQKSPIHWFLCLFDEDCIFWVLRQTSCT